MQKGEPTITAIIVNYKSAPLTLRCVESLGKQIGVSLNIIVVDNDSGPEDINLLASIQGITLIRNDQNLGFSKANNIGAQKATGDFLLIINPDAEFRGTRDLLELCLYLEQNPHVGLVGPKIIEPGKKRPTLPKRQYPEENYLRYTNVIGTLPGEIAWLLGACMLVRKNLFDAIGGFDPDYFLYAEDIDLCFRIRQSGFSIGYCQNSSVIHVGGFSANHISSFEKYLRKKRGILLFCQKHYAKKDFLRIARKMRVSALLKTGITFLKQFFVKDENSMLKWHAEYQAASEILKKAGR